MFQISKATNWSILKNLVLPLLACTMSPVGCRSAEMRQLDVSNYVTVMRSNICPSNPQRIEPLPRQQDLCGGDGTRSPCAGGDSQCSAHFVECVQQFNQDLGVLVKYNSWIDQTCRRNVRSDDGVSSGIQRLHQLQGDVCLTNCSSVFQQCTSLSADAEFQRTCSRDFSSCKSGCD